MAPRILEPFAMPQSLPLTPEELPIFPLNSVLFPAGKMNLTIFEARYMDMIARCMTHEKSFGVCLILEGEEVGSAALAHKIGTEARIVDWDMSQPGLLGLTIRGERRFHLLEQSIDAQQLVTGTVQWFDAEPETEISKIDLPLLPLLSAVIADAGSKLIPPPHRLGDAAWVGYRFAEILPIPQLARQRLLELEDASLRLSIIREYLIEHKLIKAAS
jgi:Lon protease-like protein